MSADPRSAGLHAVPASSLALVAVLTLVWGCNWPVLKTGVTELEPLTFRAATLGFAGLGLLAVSKFSGDSIRIPGRFWRHVALLALANITAWNAFILFGVQQMPAGRSAILAYTMPMWGVLFSLWLLHEPLSGRKLAGLALGMGGMAVLLGDEIAHVQRAPVGALLIICASISWGFGTVLLRRWTPPVAQNTLTGWMLVIGWVPILVAAPFFDPNAAHALATMSGKAWFAILYNIFFAGTVAHWAWFRMARTLPVAVSSLSSLPVPVVGVFSSMLFLGERPGPSEFVALAMVLASLAAVMFPERKRGAAGREPPPTTTPE
jgi:drug/metabolite transporter (DMT)-like permease